MPDLIKDHLFQSDSLHQQAEIKTDTPVTFEEEVKHSSRYTRRSIHYGLLRNINNQITAKNKMQLNKVMALGKTAVFLFFTTLFQSNNSLHENETPTVF
jgi:hypothetical protein